MPHTEVSCPWHSAYSRELQARKRLLDTRRLAGDFVDRGGRSSRPYANIRTFVEIDRALIGNNVVRHIIRGGVDQG
ncbi:hypothetical protein KX729_27115 [Rhizobium sp. XQZ8]|uniref:hypothetical protein n=1 Tax=Rhizobium populisoli TaxID=2859785 RepID=UPI001CA471C9|nr:hypothetical protein [Rhizobium populisoli]MBW6425120.1 hypothetical protein [Rhizobium populisoli]